MARDVVASAARLADEALGVRNETESKRRLPDSIVDALVDAGLYRMSVPAEDGGPEIDPPTSLEVYETLARAEASLAWVVWNSALPCLFSRFLDGQTRREIFGDPRFKFASSTRPTGRAIRENGDFRVSGRWSLVSGCEHADWLGFMCLVEADGEVEMLDEGGPHLRMAFVPADAVTIVDTWHVGGLRGTGSHDVVLEDERVPASKTFSLRDPVRIESPIGRMPIAATMAAGHAGICLGIADAMRDALIELGRSKVSPDPVPRLPDRAWNRFLVADARAKVEALRGLVHRTLEEHWELARSGEEISVEKIADAWTAAVTAARECRTLACGLYEAAGSPALYRDSPLERTHRDICAAMQHIIVQRLWLEEAGRVYFGMDPENPLFAL